MKKFKSAGSLVLFILVFNGEVKGQMDSVRIHTIPFGMFWENKALKFSNLGNEMIIVAGEKTDMFRDPNVTYNTITRQNFYSSLIRTLY